MTALDLTRKDSNNNRSSQTRYERSERLSLSKCSNMQDFLNKHKLTIEMVYGENYKDYIMCGEEFEFLFPYGSEQAKIANKYRIRIKITYIRSNVVFYVIDDQNGNFINDKEYYFDLNSIMASSLSVVKVPENKEFQDKLKKYIEVFEYYESLRKE